MDQKTFIDWINNPAATAAGHEKELKSMVGKYPWFAMARVWLVAKQKGEGRLEQHELARASLMVNDRKSLQEYLSGISPGKEAGMQDVKSLPEQEVPDELQEILKSISERKKSILESGISQGTVPQTACMEEEWKVIEPDMFVSPLPVEEGRNERFESFSEEEAMEGLGQEIMEQMAYDQNEELLALNEMGGGGSEVAPDYQQWNEENEKEEFLVEENFEVLSMGVMEEEFVAHELTVEFRTELTEISGVEAPVNVPAENPEPLYPDDTSSFEISSDLLMEQEVAGHQQWNDARAGREEKVAAEPEEVQEWNAGVEGFRPLDEVESPGTFLPERSLTFSGWLKYFRVEPEKKNQPDPRKERPTRPQETPEPDGSRFEQQWQQEIETINKVVTAIGPVELPQTISAEILAKKSSVLDEDIVSETLARVYEEQGIYDKAIRQYVRLSLKYPEKVSFFAARIKEIKSKR